VTCRRAMPAKGLNPPRRRADRRLGLSPCACSRQATPRRSIFRPTRCAQSCSSREPPGAPSANGRVGRSTSTSGPRREPKAAVAWRYHDPAARYEALRDYIAFFAGRVECWLDDEGVKAQPGDFCGGWVTNGLVGAFKGAPGRLVVMPASAYGLSPVPTAMRRRRTATVFARRTVARAVAPLSRSPLQLGE
jgi:hypothetical protein